MNEVDAPGSLLVVPDIRIGPYMRARPLDLTARGEWDILDKSGRSLGTVDYYARWRQYVFTAEEGAVLSHDCMAALGAFVKACGRGK